MAKKGKKSKAASTCALSNPSSRAVTNLKSKFSSPAILQKASSISSQPAPLRTTKCRPKKRTSFPGKNPGSSATGSKRALPGPMTNASKRFKKTTPKAIASPPPRLLTKTGKTAVTSPKNSGPIALSKKHPSPKAPTPSTISSTAASLKKISRPLPSHNHANSPDASPSDSPVSLLRPKI